MRKVDRRTTNSAWRTNDKLFMLPHEALQVASTVICGGAASAWILLGSAVCWSLLVS